MQDADEHGEKSTAEPGGRGTMESEEENSIGTLHHAFIYCTIFLLALFVAVQFDPLIGYRYPVLLLVVVVIILFAGTSLQELKQKRATHSKKQSLFIALAIIIATCIILVLMFIAENPLLFLLVPLASALLFLEWHSAHC